MLGLDISDAALVTYLRMLRIGGLTETTREAMAHDRGCSLHQYDRHLEELEQLGLIEIVRFGTLPALMRAVTE